MNVTIFGAGASHSYTKSVTGVRPPLAKELFDVFNQLDISGEIYVRVGDIIRYVCETRGIETLEFMTWNENIEDFLTEVHDKIGEYRERGIEQGTNDWVKFCELVKVHDRMIFLFSAVLNETQNGEVCPNYLRYVNSLSDGDVLATFNWDTLLDRALVESQRWNIKDGYGIQIAGTYNDEWRAEIDSAPSRLRYYKLHGSTNWIVPYHTYRVDTGERLFYGGPYDKLPVFVYIDSTTPYPTYRDRWRGGYAPFSYFYYPPNLPLPPVKPSDGHVFLEANFYPDVPGQGVQVREEKPIYGMPLIIPPVRKKEYELFTFMNSLWDEVWRTITQCDELRIIGYSFPVSDTKPWAMLENAVSYRGKKLPIHIIDPYPEQLTKRIRDRLGDTVEVFTTKSTFDEYVNTI